MTAIAPAPTVQHGLREAAIVIRREVLTRSVNRTIRTATALLALAVGFGAWFGGRALRDFSGEVGSLNFRPDTFFPVAMVVILMVALVYASTALTSGVVEEKQSRVVEILLTKIGVHALVAGKVIGIGLVTLAQLLVIGGAGAVGFTLADGWNALGIASPGASLAWLLVWFLLGYAIYALLNTALASTVSRQEDLSTALMPLNILQMVLLGVALWPGISGAHDAMWFRALSFVPLLSSYLMPVRLGMEGVDTWELAVAALIAAVTVPLLFWVTARIYRGTALRTGSRLSLRDAFTSGAAKGQPMDTESPRNGTAEIARKAKLRKAAGFAVQIVIGIAAAYIVLQFI